MKWFNENNEPPTQAHIASHAKIDKMTLSKSIRKLKINGFVLREKSSLDSRAMNVKFTEHGGRIISEAILAIENADDDFFQGGSPVGRSKRSISDLRPRKSTTGPTIKAMLDHLRT